MDRCEPGPRVCVNELWACVEMQKQFAFDISLRHF